MTIYSLDEILFLFVQVFAGSKDVQRKGNGERMKKCKGKNQSVFRELPGTVRQEEGQRGIWEPDHERS